MDSLYIDKVLSGDRHAYGYFINTYKDMAFAIAISLVKNELLAEEVAQEAFVQAYLSLSRFKKESKFSTWFYKIVVHTAYKALQKNKNDLLNLDSEVQDVQFEEHALNQILAEERKQVINDALLQIPGQEALALRLFYLEELSIKELTEVTGWTESNCKVILHRARKRLAQQLNSLLKHEYYG